MDDPFFKGSRGTRKASSARSAIGRRASAGGTKRKDERPHHSSGGGKSYGKGLAGRRRRFEEGEQEALDMEDEIQGETSEEETDLEEEETAAEKRLRLAKEWVNKLDEEAGGKEDFVASRLRDDMLKQKGQLTKAVAETVRCCPTSVRVTSLDGSAGSVGPTLAAI